jgi:hypothetical protein
MQRIIFSILIFAVTLPGFALSKQEAMDFLYSTLSLPDSADYSAKFYQDNIDASFKAREEMPWGNTVPDREFLHFVIPVRVNNENLDMSRQAFYEELKPRVKGLSMKDAILEVNHWCHEKVTYRPSDARTSSPLSSVSQAIGRCGEESTFTVAALRSVGIPARQIYTPRWAHTDDNHAWVEAWADGQWYFLGACEPEPVLNLAWFNDPASRGLLMNTNVTGDYKGPEEVLSREPLTTRINVTENYAPVGMLNVKVVDKNGKPASGAKVSFCIYNYSEYYPAATKTTGKDGTASLKAGLGDMLVWATDGKKFGFSKGRPGQPSPVNVTLDKDGFWTGTSEFDIIPPASGSSTPSVSDAQRKLNNILTHREDSIRNAYVATFATQESAAEAAKKLNLDVAKLTKVLIESRGNHNNIVAYLSILIPRDRETALNLLLNVSEKDRRDIDMKTVADHVGNAVTPDAIKQKITPDNYNRYILSPRIENEFIHPWRSELLKSEELKKIGNNPLKLAEWIESNISAADKENPLKLKMSPGAVLKERKADKTSRDIFFVAAARTLGIPARIDPVTANTEFLDGNGKWQKVTFKGNDDIMKKPTASKGTLQLTFEPKGHIVDPKYYSQFSISKITDGMPRQLEFEEDGTVSSIFASPVELEAGQYLLTSGQRLANGGVLARSEVFTIAPGENLKKKLVIRNDESEISVIGSLNAENIYHDIALDADKSLLSTTGRGYYILGLISPNHEPSTHALNDISAVKKQLEDSGLKIMLLFDNASSASRFNKSAFTSLPDNVVFGIDNGSTSRKEILESLHLKDAVNPVFVIADTFNRVVWVSTGYTIGIGDQLLNIISRIK